VKGDPRHGLHKLLPNVRTAWPWVGIGLGATTLALGSSHTVLDHDELASAAVLPLAVAVTTGIPAVVLGIVGLASERAADVGGAVACRGRNITEQLKTMPE
jgi:hypothetical protein